jgi:3-phenylpropionate/trans-cinnamate dioxygenase ferredoxin reductase subunit
MSDTHVRYLVIGGGLAGSEAARAIRERDPAGSVLLLSQEINRSYDRPALAGEYLRRARSRGQLGVLPPDWFADHHVELRTQCRVSAIDAPRRIVTLGSGEQIAADALLLATGSMPRPVHLPGAQLPGVYALRTIEDADRLLHAIDKARAEGRRHERGRGRVVVIGGGLLAPELSATLASLGLQIDLLLGGGHPWWKFAGETLGRVASHHLREQGVTLHEHARAERLDGDGRVQRAMLTDGSTIDCDFVVAALGVLPNRDLLRHTPINAEKAILTDARCRTNVEGIFAAGDCAAIFDPLFGKHRIIDHWDHARFSGALAGANMAALLGHGAWRDYDTVSHFDTHLFDLHLHAWGEPRLVHHRLVRGEASVRTHDLAEIGVAADGRVAFVAVIGREGEHASLRSLVGRRFDAAGHEEALKDPATPLP